MNSAPPGASTRDTSRSIAGRPSGDKCSSTSIVYALVDAAIGKRQPSKLAHNKIDRRPRFDGKVGPRVDADQWAPESRFQPQNAAAASEVNHDIPGLHARNPQHRVSNAGRQQRWRDRLVTAVCVKALFQELRRFVEGVLASGTRWSGPGKSRSLQPAASKELSVAPSRSWQSGHRTRSSNRGNHGGDVNGLVERFAIGRCIDTRGSAAAAESSRSCDTHCASCSYAGGPSGRCRTAR